MSRPAPLLSIGIIFKNEIRCLERCLKSLEPLRQAIPCELVMADTGADDGSRAVAERYADILIDFPWVNDFAAARNAVMERCSGTWYMSIDCDEWVDSNIEGYVTFLKTNRDFDFASVIIRNYGNLELEASGTYSDFLAVRLLRMSTGIRYEGTIHEHWPYEGDLRTMLIRGAVFHHDGYAYQDPSERKEKQERNMELLRKELEAAPDDLIILTQCIESGDGMPEQEDYLRRAIEGVEQKRPQWDLFGAPIYRYAVRYAVGKGLPELDEWIEAAEEKFPNNIFVRVEVAYFAFGNAWNKDDYEKSIYWGEKYLQGVADYKNGNFSRADILASSLNKTDPHSRLSVATVLASGYLHENQPEKCLQLMETFDGREMDAKQAGDCVRNLCNLHAHYKLDAAPLLLKLWEELNEPKPSQEWANQRRAEFLQVGAGMFEGPFVRSEPYEDDFVRHAYTTFLPLAGMCSLGDAAAILGQYDPEILEGLLGKVEHWNETPIQALAHALESGMRFPLPDKPLNIEEMDSLAARLSADRERFLPIVEEAARSWDGWDGQQLAWRRGLALAAVQSFPWATEDPDKESGLTLARIFANTEQAFLPLCYSPEALTPDGLFLLPPMHRFGWYCAQAFDALDAGDTAGYVHCLREGLAACEGVKDIVEFLLEHTPQLQAPPPSQELLDLAEKVRTILSAYPPDDPSVLALKQTPVYQQVVHLIEGPDMGLYGGLLQ